MKVTTTAYLDVFHDARGRMVCESEPYLRAEEVADP